MCPHPRQIQSARTNLTASAAPQSPHVAYHFRKTGECLLAAWLCSLRHREQRKRAMCCGYVLPGEPGERRSLWLRARMPLEHSDEAGSKDKLAALSWGRVYYACECVSTTAQLPSFLDLAIKARVLLVLATLTAAHYEDRPVDQATFPAKLCWQLQLGNVFRGRLLSSMPSLGGMAVMASASSAPSRDYAQCRTNCRKKSAREDF